MSKNRMSLEEFNEIYSKIPRICVECIIKTGEGILLTKRAIKPCIGMWHTPGGTVLFDESVEDAVKRVVKEELNLEIEDPKFLGVIDWFGNPYEMGHTVSLCYEITKFTGNIKLDYQATNAQFFKEIPENTISEHKNFLQNLR